MDTYAKAYVKTHVHIDAGGRVFCKGEELTVHIIRDERKVQLPIGKILYTFDDLKHAGAKCDVMTLKTLAHAGANGRWRQQIQERQDTGIPRNVYVANARSIQYALEHDKAPPPVRWVGRERDKITAVYDTVDEVVDAMADGLWRTEFSRGRFAKRKK